MRYPLRTLPVLLLAFAALLAAAPERAAAQGAAGAFSLQIPPGARAEGMGRFYSSVADDAFGPWWNPAGLGFMKGWNAGFMHSQLAEGLAPDVYFEHLTGSMELSGIGSLAASVTYLSYGSIDATNPDSPDPIGTFSPFEVAPSVSLGSRVFGDLALGVSLKLVHINLAPAEFAGPSGGGSGTGFAVDLGALYWKRSEVGNLFGLGAGSLDLRAGVVTSNLGPDISLTSDPTGGDPLPRNLKLSASVGGRVPKSVSFLAGFQFEKALLSNIDDPDASFWVKNQIIPSGGLEVGFVDLAFARLGYINDEEGKIQDMTFGFGVRYSVFGFDFASIPQAEGLPRVSKFSLVYRSQIL
jgi:hypothetical protein